MSKRYDKLASTLKSALPERTIDALGRVVSFIRRLREIQASLFVWSVVMSRFGHGRPGFEQARQWFVRLGGAPLWRRPFQIRFKSVSTVKLFERAFDVAVSRWRYQQRARVGHPLARQFADVVLIDSTSIALSPKLAKTFGAGGKPFSDGRRTAIVKALVCLSAFGLVPLHASLHEGLRHDTQLFPRVDLFKRGSLLLFDKGFFWKKHLASIIAHGSHFLFPMKSYCTPKIVRIVEAPAYARRAFADGRATRLRDVLARDALVSSRWDLDVLIDDEVPARLIIVPGVKRKQRCYLTTISRAAWSVAAVVELYRVRWQIELVFKELKQDLNLARIPTTDPYAAKVLIWASLLALAISRTISAVAYPATDRLGLAACARPSLTTRALRSVIRLVAHAWNASSAVRNALLRVLLQEIESELSATCNRRVDSFARLVKLVPAPA